MKCLVRFGRFDFIYKVDNNTKAFHMKLGEMSKRLIAIRMKLALYAITINHGKVTGFWNEILNNGSQWINVLLPNGGKHKSVFNSRS